MEEVGAGGFPWRAGGERAGRLSLGRRHPEVQVAVRKRHKTA